MVVSMKNIPISPGLTVSSVTPSQDEISLRAHQIWCQQGCPQGHDVDNWLEAEHQLRTESASRDTSFPRSENVGTSSGVASESPYSELSEEAPLATRVDEQVVQPGRTSNRESVTSLEI